MMQIMGVLIVVAAVVWIAGNFDDDDFCAP